MIDATRIFNDARIKKGLQPTSRQIVLVTAGIELPCGCHIHNASLSHFSAYHDENCKSLVNPKPIGKQIVGKVGSEDTACVIFNDDSVGLTNPHLGTFPCGG